MTDQASNRGLDHAANAGRHRLAERGDDSLRDTALKLPRALLQVERLPHRIWEPACGPRRNRARAARRGARGGRKLIFVDYGCPLDSDE